MDIFGIQYGYLIATLLLGGLWTILFFIRPDLRKEMLWMSILIVPAGLTERYFVPIYWNPGNLFNLINKIGFGIESIAFSFFVGGVAGVGYEVFARKHLRKKIPPSRTTRFIPPTVMFIGFFLATYFGLNMHIYSVLLAALLTVLSIIFFRYDLSGEIFFGGLSFAFVYFIIFFFLLMIFPSYVQDVFTVENLWGYYIGGVPIEELLFAFAVGAACAPLYEHIKGYKIV